MKGIITPKNVTTLTQNNGSIKHFSSGTATYSLLNIATPFFKLPIAHPLSHNAGGIEVNLTGYIFNNSGITRQYLFYLYFYNNIQSLNFPNITLTTVTGITTSTVNFAQFALTASIPVRNSTIYNVYNPFSFMKVEYAANNNAGGGAIATTCMVSSNLSITASTHSVGFYAATSANNTATQNITILTANVKTIATPLTNNLTF